MPTVPKGPPPPARTFREPQYPDTICELGREPMPGYDDEPFYGSTESPWDAA